MSRIGRMPVVIPAGVNVTVADNNVVTVKGKLGELTQKFSTLITIKIEGSEIVLTRANEDKETKALHGLTRALVANMVNGVNEGFSKKLEINGVGYRAEKAGQNLNLALGYSHPVVIAAPEGITFEVPDSNTIIVKGADKQAVGQIAAVIREKRPPEPYLGKGIKYSNEHIRRKAGKAGK
ncbi:MAG: 50S ribosomal protein L6 [Clostridia bacterium]|nr:50S ribosomal protein L6 [Clostridia bacterium]